MRSCWVFRGVQLSNGVKPLQMGSGQKLEH